jgi:hypothetical protein
VVSITPRPLFSPGESTLGTRCTGGWVGPSAGLDTEARGKILSPLPGIEPGSPGRPARSQTLYGTISTSKTNITKTRIVRITLKCGPTISCTNLMEQSPSCRANSRSSVEEISRLLELECLLSCLLEPTTGPYSGLLRHLHTLCHVNVKSHLFHKRLVKALSCFNDKCFFLLFR